MIGHQLDLLKNLSDRSDSSALLLNLTFYAVKPDIAEADLLNKDKVILTQQATLSGSDVLRRWRGA